MSRLNRFSSSYFDYSEGVFFDLELDAYRDYIQFSEKNIEKEAKKIKKEYKKFEKQVETNEENYEDGYLSHVQDNYIDAFVKVDNDFKQNLRCSQIILLFSFLETKLKEGCDSYSRGHKKEYTINQLKGHNDIDKIKIFLKKSVGVSINDLQPEWDYIDKVRKIRNKIVHHNGIIKRSDSDFQLISKFCENRFELKEEGSNTKYSINLSNSDFLFEIIENISELFQKIIIEELKANKA